MQSTAVQIELSQMFIPPPSVDWEALVIGSDLKAFEKLVDQADTTLSIWRADMTRSTRERLGSLILMAGPIPKAEAFAILSVHIGAVFESLEALIKEQSTPLHDRPDVAASLKQIAAVAPNSMKFIRKQFRRIERIRVAQYNFSVDTYYAIKSFMADLDPEADEGKTFSDPAALEKYFREQVA